MSELDALVDRVEDLSARVDMLQKMLYTVTEATMALIAEVSGETPPTPPDVAS